jgi:hypothetical protein
MSEHSVRAALSPARLRAMAEWFREFAALASAEQRRWQLDLAAFYERLAAERETVAKDAPKPKLEA